MRLHTLVLVLMAIAVGACLASWVAVALAQPTTTTPIPGQTMCHPFNFPRHTIHTTADALWACTTVKGRPTCIQLQPCEDHIQ